MKLVVVNDMHPLQNPGAASIAYSLACSAKDEWDVEYWCGWNNSNHKPDDSVIPVRSFNVKTTLERQRLENLGRKLCAEFLPGKVFWWFLLQIFKSRPDVVWVHQIGTRFPRSILIITRLLGIRTVWTIHDFGLILPRKLYPRDLGIIDSEVDIFMELLPSHSNDESRSTFSGIEHSFILKLRLIIIRGLTHLTNQMIFISPMQQQIYSRFGFRSRSIIPNGVDSCECDKNSIVRDSKSILFAGRSTGKGFELLLQALEKNLEFHLHLAGGLDLQHQAQRRLESTSFTYHGALNSSEVHSLIHKVDMVSVASECFDVYPTITLEALRHGSYPITTKVTGNFRLVESISYHLLLEYGSPIDLKGILDSINLVSSTNQEIREKLPTVKQVFGDYRSYLIKS